jgi:hypothetical protein
MAQINTSPNRNFTLMIALFNSTFNLNLILNIYLYLYLYYI